MKRLYLAIMASCSSAGFTLTELLVALVLTSLVVGLAGQGLVAALQAERRNNLEVTQRTNQSRTLEFIADEIRMARNISRPDSAAIPSSTCGGTSTGVLNLSLPDGRLIQYYVSSCSSSSWARGAVIHRREVAASVTRDSILVDALSAPATLPTCPTGMTRVGASGFYACMQSDIPTASNRTTALFLYGALPNSSGGTGGTYMTSSQVTARSF
ncbi:PulJ/GspJ family protein [Leptolyngbya ohadii]|uniref:PulJ/GspJ family protein n=1 Tax=Leptolyngbya ohadii TaxID=1962290 RepID=UPI000B59E8E5|nr:prepilin-type N-terminal cleavage/methylation domain-containing protein [Leptolyngbya ohadii]